MGQCYSDCERYDGIYDPGFGRALSPSFLEVAAEEMSVALSDYVEAHKSDPSYACLVDVTGVTVNFVPSE